MDVGGSFLELSCVRIAIVPAGPSMPDHRFDELSAHLTAFREVPVNALPRRAPVTRPASSVSFHSTFSSMTPTMREALNSNSSPYLSRSHSSNVREISKSSSTSSPSISIPKSRPPTYPSARAFLQSSNSASAVHYNSNKANTNNNVNKTNSSSTSSIPTPSSFVMSNATNSTGTSVNPNGNSYEGNDNGPGTKPASPRFHSELDLSSPDVDSSFRLRYEIIHRDHTGALLMRPSSEWDDFHSTKVWGVFGVVDCTNSIDESGVNRRDQIVSEAAHDFRSVLAHFHQSAVRRLIVFTHSDDQNHSPFVLNDPSSSTVTTTSSSTSSTSISSSSPSKSKSTSSTSTSASMTASNWGFSVGHVPERCKPMDTRLEARVQVIHFAGLLLNEIDIECWRRRESPTSELFLSPLDENLTTDRQSKLAKRRAGRLDKLLGDSLLLMGSPAEALLKYSSAIERSKASSDRLWLAGAMEGWSAAHVLAHVGNGGNANDKTLTDKLIEHYAEIYKLYQKKRVIEPEAAAAMRLAEFLGRWTNRKREALEAAQHAATVGENLRYVKRAVLWEALARFNDRMGCRRKAALYLYRLGQLNANQNDQTSAVTLMVASERQLCTSKGTKPWASLNRRVLLMAARQAEDGGDIITAAQLYVEALVISPSGLDNVGDTDQGILKSLAKVQIPAHLPAAQTVVQLDDIHACQMDGLSFRQKISGNEIVKQKPQTTKKEGPFIYNPFEAKKRAKEEADAKRTVTWVRDEPTYISLRLVSNIRAELNVEVIAVLFNEKKAAKENAEDVSKILEKTSSCHELGNSSDSDNDGKSTTNSATTPIGAENNNCNDNTNSNGEDNTNTNIETNNSEAMPKIEENVRSNSFLDDEGQSVHHTLMVREMLDRSTALARTVAESVTVYPQDRYGTTKYISVVPHTTGPLFIEGILVRLFNGALVVLKPNARTKQTEADPPVNVMHKLPNMLVNARCSHADDVDVAGRQGVVLYDGERRCISVDVRNCGSEKISWMGAKVCRADGVAALRITRDELSGERSGKDLGDLQNPDAVRTFSVEILGLWSDGIGLGDAAETDEQVGNYNSTGYNDNDVCDDNDENLEVNTGLTTRNEMFPSATDDDSIVSSLTIVIEYEGMSSPGIIRQSTSHIRVVCRRAVAVGRLVMFERHMHAHGQKPRAGVQCIGVEVRNLVSVPARVVVVQRDLAESLSDTSTIDKADDIVTEESLVEHGACARLLCELSPDFEMSLRNAVYSMYRKGAHTIYDDKGHYQKPKPKRLLVRWNLPAMGRDGIVTVDSMQVRNAAVRAWDVRRVLTGYGMRHRSVGMHVDLQVSLINCNSNTKSVAQSAAFVNDTVPIGRYVRVQVHLRNSCDVPLPPTCTLDVHVGQRGDCGTKQVQSMRGVIVVGVTRHIPVGNICDAGMLHEVKVLVRSAGCFEISACLYNNKSPAEQDDEDNEDENEQSDNFIHNGILDVEHNKGVKGVVNVIHPRTVDVNYDVRKPGREKIQREQLLACSVYRFFGVREGYQNNKT